MELRIKAKKIVQLSWTTWNDVCALAPGLVSRENPGKQTSYYHDLAGNTAGPPYVSLTVPTELSAVTTGEVDDRYGVSVAAIQGDWLVLLENDKILVIPGVPGMIVAFEHPGGNADETMTMGVEAEPFVFNEADFPKFSIWRHRNGNEYIIIGCSNTNTPSRPGYPPRVEYCNVHTYEPYSREASDWHRSMTRIR
jgi:hypothetical protein